MRISYCNASIARATGRQCSAVSNTPGVTRPIVLRNYTTRRESLSKIWTPTGGIAAARGDEHESISLLTRAGYVRQSGSGIFHMLPLGLRVQEKIESLIDKHMRKLGASKVSLSSITSEAIWAKSGRFKADGTGQSEMFRLQDARSTGTGLLLSPTHEEEITAIAAHTVKSYKELPLRLYQISRKYRNELRPRQGLLRAKEFIMKDLYTFDLDNDRAMKTYDEVRQAYTEFFNELKIPYITAEADSGNMGGSISHEFHFAIDAGEDNVITCDSCSYAANEEKAIRRRASDDGCESQSLRKVFGISPDKRDIVVALIPHNTHEEENSRLVNWHAVRAAAPITTINIVDSPSPWILHNGANENNRSFPKRIFLVADYRIPQAEIPCSAEAVLQTIGAPTDTAIIEYHQITSDSSEQPLDLLSIATGDGCAKCDSGTLRVQRAVELGHTFHLGTRYSEPLGAQVGLPTHDVRYNTTTDQKVPMVMGCHGIGVSRLLGAVASILADSKGLNWPRVIAPFEAVIIADEGFEAEGRRLHSILRNLQIDVVADDRKATLVWKLKDADLIGYPVVLVVTKRSWARDHAVEVQCRRLNRYKKLHRSEEEDLGLVVRGLLEQL